MDKLDQLRIFVQVADMGSFIKAANALDLPRASVSAAVQELESSLATRLLHRTTRRVQLTADGVQLLDRVRPLLGDVEDIYSLFQTRQKEVSGRLSVDVPSRIARRLIAPALPGFLRRYPRLQLGLGSTDRAIDLVHEGVDCVVRAGNLNDSSLVVHPLGHFAVINCASPDYLRAKGAPGLPDELAQGHEMVGYASPTTAREQPWEFLVEGELRSVAVASQVVVNNAESYIACCLAGVGLIQIPRFDVQHLLDRGELVEVMPDFRAAAMPVSLLYPHRRQRSRRLNAFIEWFEALIRPQLEAHT
ncbi:LysR family transcriptional regulator [Paraburkholderia bryophila]|uniref:LysR substrate-binding domain-containing protein n=1 Tax=Burkholderiaceae TaxID=119060 RepID=UPI00054F5897|nr:LysR family transcriptional regulator [Burkholderia sp. 9120]